jgi:arsenate reductase
MKTAKREATIIFDGNDLDDRAALAYALSLNFKLKEVNLRKNILTERQIKEIAMKLDIDPEQLIDEHSSQFRDEFKKSAFSADDSVKILRQNPDLMKTPILIMEHRAVFIGSSYDLIKS